MFGVSERTISRALKSLEDRGLLRRETRNIKGGKERHLTATIDNLAIVRNESNITTDKMTVEQQTICPLNNRQNDLIKDNILKDNSLKDNRGISCASATNPIGIYENVDREALAAARTPAERMKALGF